MLHAVGPAEELACRALERGQRRFRVWRVEAGPLVRAVTGALDQSELLDVARDRRLGRREAALAQTATQRLLAVESLAIDEFGDNGLAARLHDQWYQCKNTGYTIYGP